MEELNLGTVTNFKKQRGFGHIEPDDKTLFGGKVYCHWKTIQTSAKWPTLVAGMRVAFAAVEGKTKEASWKTTEVYNEDGDEITLDSATKDTKVTKATKSVKDVLLNGGKKYRGSCKSYDKSKGSGLIKTDGSGPWPKTGLKLLRADITCDGGAPSLRKGLRLQFQVAKKGASYRAVAVTLPGGRNVPTEVGGKTEAKKTVAKVVKKPVAKKAQKKADKKPQPVKKAQAAKKSQKKVVKKPKANDNRKRQLSQVSKVQNPPAKKKNNTSSPPKKSTFKPSNIQSGVYGGMEVDEEDVVEVGLLLRSHWAGILIGKKGSSINEIRKISEANMKFGEDEIEYDGGLFKVFAISGTMSQVADACKMVTEKLGEAAQTLEYKIVFLVPDAFCGMFIGKKGATINEIRGDTDLRVRVMLSQDPISLPGSSEVTLCTVYGPRENMQESIERTVAVLGAISTRLKKQAMEPNQWGGDGGWDSGFRGQTREVGGWGGGRGGGRSGGQGQRRGGTPGGRRGGRW